jgi:hypothetical protein
VEAAAREICAESMAGAGLTYLGVALVEKILTKHLGAPRHSGLDRETLAKCEHGMSDYCYDCDIKAPLESRTLTHDALFLAIDDACGYAIPSSVAHKAADAVLALLAETGAKGDERG